MPKTVKTISIKVGRAKVAEGSALYKVTGRAIVSPEIVADMVRAVIGETDQEHFVVLPVDIKNRPLGVEIVHKGQIDACPVDPRAIFRAAIVLGASAIVVAHNHPSGDPTPSAEDFALTERLRKAGEIVGVPILDHVVVADGEGFYSFAASGRFE